MVAVFLAVVVGVMLTYPVQVALCRVDVSVGKVVAPVAILWGIALTVSRFREKLTISRGSLLLAVFLWGLVAWYALSAGVNGVGDRSGTWTLQMLLQYALWLSALLLVSEHLAVRLPNTAIEAVVCGVLLLNVAAVFAQAIGHRAPQALVLTYPTDTLFVGPFMRAGRIYADPNALGMMLVFQVVLTRALVSRAIFLRRAVIALGFASLVLTFSRAAILLAGGAAGVWLLWKGIRRFGWRVVGGVTLVVVAFAGAAYVVLSGTSAPVTGEIIEALANRFIGQEGVDSAYSRIRQYRQVIEAMDETPRSWLIGLGPGVADDLFNEHVHNFLLATLADAGVPALLLLLVLLLGFWLSARNRWARLFLLYAVVQLSTLPNFYNLIFIPCGFCMVTIHETKKRLYGGSCSTGRADSQSPCLQQPSN